VAGNDAHVCRRLAIRDRAAGHHLRGHALARRGLSLAKATAKRPNACFATLYVTPAGPGRSRCFTLTSSTGTWPPCPRRG